MTRVAFHTGCTALLLLLLASCFEPTGEPGPGDAATLRDAANEGGDAAGTDVGDAALLDAAGPDAAEAPDVFVAPPIRITSAALLQGEVGVQLALQLTAAGGVPPYAWSKAGDFSLPEGFTLSDDGLLVGTPVASGDFPFGVVVADTEGSVASATLQLAVPAPVSNDTCTTAMPLTLVSGSAHVAGSLAHASADGVSAACQQTPERPDAFYRLTLAEPAQLSVQVSEGFLASIMTGGCARSDRPLLCAAEAQSFLPAGEVLIAVVAIGDESEYSLDLEANAVTGDSCADPIPLELHSGTTTVTGTFDQATNDLASSCATGPSRVYSILVTATADLSATVLPSGSEVGLALLGECLGTELVCSPETTWPALSAKALPPGTYYFVVSEGLSGWTRGFALEITLAPPSPPPANDTCETATPLSFVDDHAQMQGTFIGAHLEAASTCSKASFADTFFVVDLFETSNLVIERTFPVNDRVEILSGACGQLTSVQCGNCAFELEPGRYYLRALGFGDYAVGVSREPFTTASNADCSTPYLIGLNTHGYGSVEDYLVHGGHDRSLPCASDPTARSLVYSLSVAEKSDLSVNVESGHAVGIIGGDCAGGSVLACGGYGDVRSWGLPAGQYFVVVQEVRPWSQVDACFDGHVDITVQAVPAPLPAPANDTCAGPIEYLFAGPGHSAELHGDVVGASENFTAGASCATHSIGRDVVYSITLQAAAQLWVSALPGSDDAFYYFTDACGAVRPAGCGRGSRGFTTDVLPPGTYHLVVTMPGFGASSQTQFDLVVDAL